MSSAPKSSNTSPSSRPARDGAPVDPIQLTMSLRQLTIKDIINFESQPPTPPAKSPRDEHGNLILPGRSPGSCCDHSMSSSPAGFGVSPATRAVLKIGDDVKHVDVNTHALQHYFVTRHPHRHCSVDELLNYNRKWSNYMNENDPEYFKELAKRQAPKFLWIGCADSRVPANEILGLAPGDVFVHRNVANVVYPSDLNCFSCVQFGVEHLKIEHLIICGHYECGGIKAAYYDLELGLVDNWVANIRDIKHRYWFLIEKVPEDERVATLCEINAIVQARHVASSTVVQRWWATYRKLQGDSTHFGSGEIIRNSVEPASAAVPPGSPLADAHHNVTVHGWIYGLSDGLVHPLVQIGPYDNVQQHCEDAIHRCVAKRSPEVAEELRRKAGGASNFDS